jgi:methionyl-tRNA formyltransferase
VYTTEEVNSPDWVAKIAALNPDVIFSFYYRKMIGREILDLPEAGAFNLHGSYLPHYRGRCPVNWVIINGEKQTGVTLHYMIEKPDAGDIAGQKAVAIGVSDTAKTLYDKLCCAAKELLDEVLPLIKKGQISRQAQDLTQGSYFGGRRPEDGRIDWKRSAGEIYNLIRGVTEPYPGAFAFLDDNKKIIIWWAEPVSAKDAPPGKLIVDDKEILVQTGKNAIKILDIEVEGERLKGKQIQSYFRKNNVRELK